MTDFRDTKDQNLEIKGGVNISPVRAPDVPLPH